MHFLWPHELSLFANAAGTSPWWISLLTHTVTTYCSTKHSKRNDDNKFHIVCPVQLFPQHPSLSVHWPNNQLFVTSIGGVPVRKHTIQDPSLQVASFTYVIATDFRSSRSKQTLQLMHLCTATCHQWTSEELIHHLQTDHLEATSSFTGQASNKVVF